jgi:putative spermidine/putrescine transport system ATP-binding protein
VVGIQPTTAGGTAIAACAMTVRSENTKLQVHSLRKVYGSFVALETASLDVREGEFLTLLGPSGSGKTTLLLAIAGLNAPDGGEILIDGKPATHLPPFKRDIGMVFQNYALFPHMNVADNVAFPLRMRRRPEAEIAEAVSRVLDIIQLPQIAERYPRQLSGGQQQRVALARALVYEPSIVLMDEPLGALDKKLRDQLQLEIKRLHEALGISVLYVTHDQEEALVMSDRICLMREGRIEQLGTPDDLYFRPRSVFAADFLGESNLLDGTVSALDDGRASVRLSDGTELRGMSGDDLTIGEPVRLMVRPEAVQFLGESAADPGNVITAALRDTVMSGGTTKYFFATSTGLELRSQVLTAGPSGASAVTGRDYRLGWPCERAFVIKDR